MTSGTSGISGTEQSLLTFMEGQKDRYIIPVYQRRYEWRIENCRQLYNDIEKIVKENRESHFFGSIISVGEMKSGFTDYNIIDGQQRLTTVTLLLLAMRNLIRSGKIQSEDNNLDQQINEMYLINRWVHEDYNIKIHPVKSDREALEKLFNEDENNFDNKSILTLNYNYFCEMLTKEELSIDDIYAAIGKLIIINVNLTSTENAQVVFESINSSGLNLSEGDKIRNYILMGLSPEKQNEYFKNYWEKIEHCVGEDVSNFTRDYLSIKNQSTPNINKVYQEFKSYKEKSEISTQNLLIDMLIYARLYEKLLTCNCGLENIELDACLRRLQRLNITVSRPFFMEVLHLCVDLNKISVNDLLKIFNITENYILRRNICGAPTNALNKIFLRLNKEIQGYDGTTNNYLAKFIYALISKRESGRFPDDKEFDEALSTKQIYKMTEKYKEYIFERFENFGTVETKDVYTQLDNNVYTIDHIMPQTLTLDWKNNLGTNYEEIFETWLHRLANLTLTGYNSHLSNMTFIEKRDIENGYKESGLRMNQKIARKNSWGLTELEERNNDMIERANEIWPYPQTEFIPKEREYDYCTLDDDEIDLTNRDIVKFSYLDYEQNVSNWAEMLVSLIKILYREDKSVLISLAYNNNIGSNLKNFISLDKSDLRTPVKIDENLYISTHSSTPYKITILRQLFDIYNINKNDLVFFLKDKKSINN